MSDGDRYYEENKTRYKGVEGVILYRVFRQGLQTKGYLKRH